ncbi:MAG TPA: hypothetical protein VI383_09470 [Gemmatimonadales bacterium]|nr:hypothetical protein [Gemmatimonadales bacterium]
MTTTAATLPRSSSIISPIVDFLSVGGLSMIVLIPLLLSGVDDIQTIVSLGAVAWAQLIVNYAHFMQSYRIVYRDRDMILKHKWATIGIPLLMIVGVVLAIVEVDQGSRVLLTAFFAIGSGYLAWHYTGQAWGMMVSFAHLRGSRFDRVEYWMIRGGLRLLLAWHVAWFMRYWTSVESYGPVASLNLYAGVAYDAATYGSVLAFGLGAIGLIRMRLRTGQAPPFRGVVAWAAIFVWYAAVARWGLAGLFLVQFAHALQYLEFPARLEINRAIGHPGGHPVSHMLGYAAALIGVTFLVTLFVPGPTKAVAAGFFGAGPESVAPILVSYFIAIHHFFTDGVIWKLRMPEVQKELFAHARPVAATVPVPPLWWEKRFWQRGWRKAAAGSSPR